MKIGESQLRIDKWLLASKQVRMKKMFLFVSFNLVITLVYAQQERLHFEPEVETGNAKSNIGRDYNACVPLIGNDGSLKLVNGNANFIKPEIGQVTVIKELICSGEKYSFNGVTYSQSGIYPVTLKTSSSNDSLVVLQLKIAKRNQTIINYSTCSNTPYVFGNKVLTKSGIYIQHEMNRLGCDSVIALNLTVYPSIVSEFNVSICQGKYYLWNGQTYHEPGKYNAHFKSRKGCDSLVILNLQVINGGRHLSEVTLAEGQTYTFHKFACKKAGTYTLHLTTADGCDSIDMLVLRFEPKVGIGNSALTVAAATSNENGTSKVNGIRKEELITEKSVVER